MQWKNPCVFISIWWHGGGVWACENMYPRSLIGDGSKHIEAKEVEKDVYKLCAVLGQDVCACKNGMQVNFGGVAGVADFDKLQKPLGQLSTKIRIALPLLLQKLGCTIFVRCDNALERLRLLRRFFKDFTALEECIMRRASQRIILQEVYGVEKCCARQECSPKVFLITVGDEQRPKTP